MRWPTRPVRFLELHHSPGGFGVLEALVAVALVALLTAAAVPALGNFVDARRLDGAAARLAADLQLARAETTLRSATVRMAFGSNASGSCYLLHTGSPGSCACLPDGGSVCSGAGVAIKSVGLPTAGHVQLRANVASIAFDPLHGTCTPTGTLNFTAVGGRVVRHVVNVMGRVRSCTPNAAPGYPPC